MYEGPPHTFYFCYILHVRGGPSYIMQRRTLFIEGEHYHIYNRGVDKGNVFRNQKDWEHFQYLLYLSNGTNPLAFNRVRGDPFEWSRGKTLTDILAYAVMPNHFHLIVREKTKGGISKFLGKFLTAYSMYFNTKYNRSGPLFCRPSRAKHIDSDEYFRWVFAYVHLNPIDLLESDWKEKGLRDTEKARLFMQSYSFSSFPDYFGEARQESRILEKKALPIPEVHRFDRLLSDFANGTQA
jgi:putative transposase